MEDNYSVVNKVTEESKSFKRTLQVSSVVLVSVTTAEILWLSVLNG